MYPRAKKRFSAIRQKSLSQEEFSFVEIRQKGRSLILVNCHTTQIEKVKHISALDNWNSLHLKCSGLRFRSKEHFVTLL